MRQTLRPLIAEFIGTFFLCFPGIAAAVAESYRPGLAGGMVGIALAHGIGLAIGITTTMAVSGGHLNPAVTIGLWSVGRIDGKRAGLYVLAQLLGGIVAALAVKDLYPQMAAAATQLGMPRLSGDISMPGGIALEAIATFLLAWAVMGSCVDNRAPRLGGFVVGLTVMIDIFAIGTLTGAAMNPARAFAPALVTWSWTAQAVYWIGPIIGSIVAMQIYERMMIERQ